MNNYDKEYDAFDIFEAIIEKEDATGKLFPADSISDRNGEEAACRVVPEKILPKWMDEEKKEKSIQQNLLEPRDMQRKEAGSSTGRNRSTSSDSSMYYEIEYDSCPMPGLANLC